MKRNASCWCGSGKKWKKCHYPTSLSQKSRVDPAFLARNYKRQFGIVLKTPEEIDGVRKACHLARSIVEQLCQQAKAGVTTNELNDLAYELHQKARAIPACLGYGTPPFLKSICTSRNEVICHGIPDDQPLIEGDILNIDVASILDGYFGDCSNMVCIGRIDVEKQKVVDVSYECLHRAISILTPGVLLSEIGNTIEKHAHAHGCSVVHQFVAHGIGMKFHEPPQIPHHSNQLSIPLVEGMIFTIEPMINAGTPEGVIDPKDQWTTRTADGKPSAQWEHTVLITETGHEILTPYTHV